MKEKPICRECGSEDVRFYRRIATFGEALRRLVLVGGAVALGLGVVNDVPLYLVLGAAVIAIAVAAPYSGIRYWGGFACRACGHREMYR